jgi:hypothetical protein
MSLKRQLQELQAATEAEARRLPPDEAREVRAASLAQARELAERSSGPSLIDRLRESGHRV